MYNIIKNVSPANMLEVDDSNEVYLLLRQLNIDTFFLVQLSKPAPTPTPPRGGGAIYGGYCVPSTRQRLSPFESIIDILLPK